MARKHVQPGFFDLDDRYDSLSEIGDPLEQLAEVIDFEPFRYRLARTSFLPKALMSKIATYRHQIGPAGTTRLISAIPGAAS